MNALLVVGAGFSDRKLFMMASLFVGRAEPEGVNTPRAKGTVFGAVAGLALGGFGAVPIFAVSRGADLVGNAGAVRGADLALVEGLVAVALVVQLQTEVARVYTA